MMAAYISHCFKLITFLSIYCNLDEIYMLWYCFAISKFFTIDLIVKILFGGLYYKYLNCGYLFEYSILIWIIYNTQDKIVIFTCFVRNLIIIYRVVDSLLQEISIQIF